MDLMLKYLINQLETVDGNRGSAKKLVATRLQIEEERFKKLVETAKLDPVQQSNINQLN